METEWRLARERLRDLLGEDTKRSHRELAEQLGYSVAWVRKWRRRLAHAASEDEQVLHSQSHRPKRLPVRSQPRWKSALLHCV